MFWWHTLWWHTLWHLHHVLFMFHIIVLKIFLINHFGGSMPPVPLRPAIFDLQWTALVSTPVASP